MDIVSATRSLGCEKEPADLAIKIQRCLYHPFLTTAISTTSGRERLFREIIMSAIIYTMTRRYDTLSLFFVRVVVVWID